MGGIEGLVMRKNVVVTCSSDDCLSVIKVKWFWLIMDIKKLL